MPSLYTPGQSSRTLNCVLDFLTTSGAVAGMLAIVTMLVMLVIVLLSGAWPAIQKFGLSFFWTSRWDKTENFGAWPVIQGTLLSSFIALVVAVPISVGAAVFLVRVVPSVRGVRWQIARGFVAVILGAVLFILFNAFFSQRSGGIAIALAIGLATCGCTIAFMRNNHLIAGVSFLIELLAAIPSITYGLWGIMVMVPFIHDYVDPIFTWIFVTHKTWFQWFQWGVVNYNKFTHKGEPFYFPASFFTPTATSNNILSAGLILAVMITPIISSITRDVLRVVPKDLEQGAYGVGATWWQATKVVLSYSKMGILGAVILGLGRALGETMAVTTIIGSVVDKPVYNIFQSGATISSLLASEFPSPLTDMHRQSMVYAALVLLLVTMLINGAARIMVISIGRRERK